MSKGRILEMETAFGIIENELDRTPSTGIDWNSDRCRLNITPKVFQKSQGNVRIRIPAFRNGKTGKIKII